MTFIIHKRNIKKVSNLRVTNHNLTDIISLFYKCPQNPELNMASIIGSILCNHSWMRVTADSYHTQKPG